MLTVVLDDATLLIHLLVSFRLYHRGIVSLTMPLKFWGSHSSVGFSLSFFLKREIGLSHFALDLLNFNHPEQFHT